MESHQVSRLELCFPGFMSLGFGLRVLIQGTSVEVVGALLGLLGTLACVCVLI